MADLSFQNLRYLIVNADDLGYTPGVNRGIIRAHNEGIVTSTSVMANMPYAEEGIALAQAEAPRLGLGLHLNISAGRPVSEDVPDLVGAGGGFHPKAEVMRRLPAVDIAQAEREFRAQAARFEALAGSPPDHLDSHHHVTYLNPALFEVQVRLARELGVPIRRPAPSFDEETLPLFASQAQIEDMDAARERFAAMQAKAEALHYTTTDNLVLRYFGEHTVLGDLLNVLIDTPGGSTELMCHPAEIDAELEAKSTYVEFREQELEALTHRSARELLTSEGIVLVSFGQLANVSG